MAGYIVIVAFISPYEADRVKAKKLHEESGILFKEIHISTSLECCEERDVKGLYKKARAGEIPNFTGISDPYEAPLNPDLELNTEKLNLAQCEREILKLLDNTGVYSDKLVMPAKHIVKEYDTSSVSVEMGYEELNLLQLIKDGNFFYFYI
jgi:adenylylsulfate kinase-like enzyme